LRNALPIDLLWIGNALRFLFPEMANSCDFAFHFPDANVSAQAIHGHLELSILVALMSMAGINVGYINPQCAAFPAGGDVAPLP
jgi:hypothetical protein